MKLIAKTSFYYFILSLVLLIAGGIIFYFLINTILNEEINEQLSIEKQKLLAYINEKKEIPPASPLADGLVSFVPTSHPAPERFTDTILLSPLQDEMLPYRQVSFTIKIKEQYYTAGILKPLIEKDDLMDTILQSLGIIGLALLIIIFTASRWLSAKLWKPFYHTLQIFKKYDVNKNESLLFTATSTEEFSQLNEATKKMTEKIQGQYRNLKEFTENASHEIQTPLAIIRNKLELLLQSENLPAREIKLVQDVYESANRLSKLNQMLLLLAKIENRQFQREELLNLRELAENKLNYFDEMIRFKNITVEKKITDPFVIKMNPQLADILFSNLIGNAINHNINGGKIVISANENLLVFSNTGSPKSLPISTLFQRFSKGSSSSESVGLGLAIVKQICDTYHYTISYSFSADLHSFTLRF
jgi:signal transduction histidine kinase